MPPSVLNKKPVIDNGKPKSVAEVLASAPKDRISGDLGKLPLVPLDQLVHDPMNARLHPERNLESIKLSLALYGQRSNITVNRRTMHVEKGNGTLMAARALGWTCLAVSFEDDDEQTAQGYGLADNRTAELAEWNMDAVARITRLQAEFGLTPAGWSPEELMIVWQQAAAPIQFREFDENVATDSQCPRCGYRWSAGKPAVNGESK